MIKCPCNGCTEETGRKPGCHGPECPRGYMEWKEKKAEHRKIEQVEVQLDAFQKDRYERRKKKAHRMGSR